MHFLKHLKHLMLALALCGAAPMASCAEADPTNGLGYLFLPDQQNTDSVKKVEVIEFFAYYCPHCYVLEPSLKAWAKKHGENIVFKRVHVSRDANVAPQQRLFFTLEALGLTEQYHDKVFHAMHVERQRLNSDELVFEFVTKQGIDRKKFIDAYGSFGVAAKMRRANEMMNTYKVDAWPMIAMGGRFITSPSLANVGGAKDEAELHAQTLAIMDRLLSYLVLPSKAEKK
jgi:thiol:disulfide interchange protein DsbA